MRSLPSARRAVEVCGRVAVQAHVRRGSSSAASVSGHWSFASVPVCPRACPGDRFVRSAPLLLFPLIVPVNIDLLFFTFTIL